MKKERQAGKFTVLPGKEIFGELTLAGKHSMLYLQDKEHFDPRGAPNRCIFGTLNDSTRVSLIECVSSGTGQFSGGDVGYHYAEIFPHYVVRGRQYLDHTQKCITKMHFLMDDARTLFDDFSAFGLIWDAHDLIDQVVARESSVLNRRVETGDQAKVMYFAGKQEIFAANTVIGRVSAAHHPIPKLPGPDGVGLRNRIFVTAAFDAPIDFDEVISRMATLKNYFGLIVGRPQNLLSFHIEVGPPLDPPRDLAIHWSNAPKWKRPRKGPEPHSAEMLVNPVEKPGEFSGVLAAWLSRNPSFRDARWRFFNSFEGLQYDVDRLIACANMFDILPDSAVPPDVQLSGELEAAREGSRRLFADLPPTPERDRVLGELGRIGKSSLKHKIRHRAQIILALAGGRFPELCRVTDEAVNCRNHYVHGSEPRFDYNANFNAVVFFTDTLEFVFALSDMIEAGWDIRSWLERPTTGSHRFALYRVSYGQSLGRLKALLPRR